MITKLSASSIKTYESCAKKYHYTYIEKPPIKKVEWPHLELGTCAHRALELFHEEILAKEITSGYPELMADCFRRAVKEGNKTLIKEVFPEIKEILKNYLGVIEKNGMPPVIHTELEFLFKLSEFNIKGFIDRVDMIAPGHYEVVDYKTSKNPKYLDAFQLEVYAIALMEKYPDVERVDGAYILLKHNSSRKEYSFTKKGLEETKQKIIQTGKDLNVDKDWAKNPTKLCDWCDYKSICQNEWV